jgi:hypothetical protein
MRGITGLMEAVATRTVEPLTNGMTASGVPALTWTARTIDRASERLIDTVDNAEDRLPFWLFVGKAGYKQSLRAAFDLGRLEGYRAEPAPLAPVRRLHAVQ